MKRSTILRTAAILSGFGIITPVFAAETPTSASKSDAGTAKPVASCMSDVRAFTAQMSKQGYWLGASDYGYGYPIGGYGYGYGPTAGGSAGGANSGYATARSGYAIRTLIASANILAQTGYKEECEGVLSSARALYTSYASNLHDRGLPFADESSWRQRQIAAAQPVTGKGVSFRSDQLLDADVVNLSNEMLGSVHDLVTNPQTGAIAYVVMSRGGLFGIDASYTPVPWGDFKVSPDGGLLVLDTTKAVVAAGPQGGGDQFTKAGQFDAESQKVATYWTAHVKPNAAQ